MNWLFFFSVIITLGEHQSTKSYKNLFYYTVAGVETIRGPLNATAIVGSTASFECILSRTSLFPWWNINGIDFTVTNLPTGFEFESNSYSYVLTVSPVQQEMNNSRFSCFLLFLNGRKESAHATLVIKQHSVYTQHTLTPATSASIPPSAATVALVSTSGLYSHTHTSNLPQPNPSAKDSSRHLICKYINTHEAEILHTSFISLQWRLHYPQQL